MRTHIQHVEPQQRRYPRSAKPRLPSGPEFSVPLVVGIAGAGADESETCLDIALLAALRSAQKAGASTLFLGLQVLETLCREIADGQTASPAQSKFISALARADGLIIAGCSQDGALSTTLREVLAHFIEDHGAQSSMFRDMPVGCVVAAREQRLAQWGLTALRSRVHELGGWPSPTGVAIDLSRPPFNPNGSCFKSSVGVGLDDVGQQVVDFAMAQRARSFERPHAAA